MPIASDGRLRKTSWVFFSYLNLRDCALMYRFESLCGFQGAPRSPWKPDAGTGGSRPSPSRAGEDPGPPDADFSRAGSVARPARPCSGLPRKEVIQPHLPIRLPCYDLTPIIGPTFDSCLLSVSSLASGVPNFHGLTGGVYKARERIHRGMLIRDY